MGDSKNRRNRTGSCALGRRSRIIVAIAAAWLEMAHGTPNPTQMPIEATKPPTSKAPSEAQITPPPTGALTTPPPTASAPTTKAPTSPPTTTKPTRKPSSSPSISPAPTTSLAPTPAPTPNPTRPPPPSTSIVLPTSLPPVTSSPITSNPSDSPVTSDPTSKAPVMTPRPTDTSEPMTPRPSEIDVPPLTITSEPTTPRSTQSDVPPLTTTSEPTTPRPTPTTTTPPTDILAAAATSGPTQRVTSPRPTTTPPTDILAPAAATTGPTQKVTSPTTTTPPTDILAAAAATTGPTPPPAYRVQPAVNGYLSIGPGRCLDTDAPGPVNSTDYYNAIQIRGTTSTPEACAKSCQQCLCYAGKRGYFYVGFEFTSESKCNCLLDYKKCKAFVGDDTCGVLEDLTRNDLNSLNATCTISDAVIPADGTLRTGTGAVIGSDFIGDESFCYSVGTNKDPMENNQKVEEICGTPRPTVLPTRSPIIPKPTPIPTPRPTRPPSSNLFQPMVGGYVSIGSGKCLSTSADGQGNINEFQYNGIQISGTTSTPLECAESCETCLCGLWIRGFYYVGFEFTSNNMCNCLLDYQTTSPSENLTLTNLNQIKDQCTESDAVFPANDPLYNGTGAVIGSVGFGNQFLCYSIGTNEDPVENNQNFKNICATPRPTGSPTRSPIIPTPQPTKQPVTPKPTNPPIPKPTRKPSLSPTISPTVSPTMSPTLEPTIGPTLTPSVDPTIKPTLEPTFNPTIAPTLDPTLPPNLKARTEGPSPPYEFNPTSMKPTYRPPWGSTPDKPYPGPPSWGWGSTPDKPYPKPPGTDDWIVYPPSPGMSMSYDDDWPWGPIFPGKSSKAKASKWMKGSWGPSTKGSKSGCIHISNGKGTNVYVGDPCVGYVGDQLWGKSGKGSNYGYSSIMDFQSSVLKNSSERIRPHRIGLSLVLLYYLNKCFVMV